MKIYFISALIVSISIFSAAVILVLSTFFHSDYLLAIHFDNFKGIDLFGDKWLVFGILTVGLFIGALNFILAGAFYNRDRFLSLLLSYATVAISILILMAIGVIISIN